jgi:hypothetical protein
MFLHCIERGGGTKPLSPNQKRFGVEFAQQLHEFNSCCFGLDICKHDISPVEIKKQEKQRPTQGIYFPCGFEVLLLQQLKKSPHRLRGDAGIAGEFRVVAHAYPIRSGAL